MTNEFTRTWGVPRSATFKPELREDVRLDDGRPSDEIVFTEVWHENVYRVEPHMLRGGAVVDLGANVGAFATLALSMMDRGDLIAVEPDEQNHAQLVRNLDTLSYPHNIHAQAVLAAVAGRHGFASMQGVGGNAQTVVDPDGDVRAFTLGKLCQTVDDIDVLKVDIEGGEWDVFSQDSDAWLVMPRVRWLVMEYHSIDEATIGQFLGTLLETHCFDIVGRPSTGGNLWAHRHDV